MAARLSTCAVCAGTIEHRPAAVADWGHVTETSRTADGHWPQPDDGAVSYDGPRCEDCGDTQTVDDGDRLCPDCIGTGAA